MAKDQTDKVTAELPATVKRGRPATGQAMTPAQRQRESRRHRKSVALAHEDFTAKQISVLLSPKAAMSLSMLAYKSDKSQKEIIEQLLIEAYRLQRENSY